MSLWHISDKGSSNTLSRILLTRDQLEHKLRFIGGGGGQEEEQEEQEQEKEEEEEEEEEDVDDEFSLENEEEVAKD